MKDISFILPTNRPFNEYGQHIVNDVHNIMEGEDYDYEVIVYSPEEPCKHPNIKWVEEKPDINSSALGFNVGYKESCGKYVYTLTDYISISKSALKAIEFLESGVFKDRRFKVTSLIMEPINYATTHMPVIGSRCCPAWANTKIHVNQPVGPAVPTDLPWELCNPKYLKPENKHSIMTHPVLDMDTVDNLMCGHILNPKFKHHYADNWIGFFIGEKGGEFPLLCEGADVASVRTHKQYYGNDNEDFKTFCQLAVDLIHGKYKEYV